MKSKLLILFALVLWAVPSFAQHSIPWAKIQGNGSVISAPDTIPNEVVTYTFPEYGYFYIQESLRFSGMRIYSATMPNPGDIITITGGSLLTTSDGEKALNSATYTTQSSGNYPFKPLGLTNKTLGGGPFQYTSIPHTQVLQNTATQVSVTIQQSGTPPPGDPGTFYALGVAYNDPGLVVTYQKAGGSVITRTLVSSDWTEVGAGVYTLQIPTTELDTLGTFQVWVAYTGYVTYLNQLTVTTTIVDPTLGQTGVTGGTGLNNIGLLVRSWGKVTDIEPTYYLIDDGSGVNTIVNTEVAPGQTIPTTGLSVGTYVPGITGVSSLVYAVSGVYTRMLNLSAPTCKITLGANQLNPVFISPINFTATFSEPVTGFTAAGVVLGGEAAPTTKVVTDSGDHKTFNIAVSGMAAMGAVTVDIPTYGAATSLAYGGNSLRAAIIANSVTWRNYRIYNKREGVGGGRNPKNSLK